MNIFHTEFLGTNFEEHIDMSLSKRFEEPSDHRNKKKELLFILVKKFQSLKIDQKYYQNL